MKLPNPKLIDDWVYADTEVQFVHRCDECGSPCKVDYINACIAMNTDFFDEYLKLSEVLNEATKETR